MGHTCALRAVSSKLYQVWVQLQAETGIAALCCTAPFKPDGKPIDVSLRSGLSVNCSLYLKIQLLFQNLCSRKLVFSNCLVSLGPARLFYVQH